MMRFAYPHEGIMTQPIQEQGSHHGATLVAPLRKHFEFTTFRPGQQAVIEAVLGSGRALAVFPTGGGKSLCYQLPALLLDGLTLVVSPLIALMHDQVRALQQRGIAAASLDSTRSAAEVRATTEAMRAGTLRLLYVAPERIANERFRQVLARTPIALLAIDEAHCVSSWGHNFRPDYLKLAGLAEELHIPRVLALTATAPPPVVADICAAFAIPSAHAVITSGYRPNLQLHVTPTPADARTAMLLARLRQRPRGTTIVYVTHQHTAETLAARLTAEGVAAQAYHAGMEAEARAAVQAHWTHTAAAVVVATIAFGMGIDKADVRAIYHYNLPKTIEHYVQEIGRAGRDGAASVVEIFGTAEDRRALENFTYGDTPEPAALRGLAEELLTGEEQLDVNVHALASAYDMRPLVVRTALTYLELDGVLRQGSPRYATYQFQPQAAGLDAIAAQFQGERQQFLRQVFAQARAGRSWHTLDVDAAAAALGAERGRIVRALDYLAEQGQLTLKVADVRYAFTRLHPAPDVRAIAAGLAQRFADHEQRELGRLQHLLAVLGSAQCQTNALLRYFGEQREAQCGHCTACTTGQAPLFDAPEPLPDIAALMPRAKLQALRDAYPSALGTPRQQARFLCGLSSPAQTRARLARHPACGLLRDHAFAEVLAWCARDFSA
jgi:ATP-dependent DNA helicase RecQ